MGSGSEALGWKIGFRTFHRAKMSSQVTLVNTGGCIFLPKNKLNTLRLYTCAKLHTHMHICGTGRYSVYCAHTKAHVIATLYIYFGVTKL